MDLAEARMILDEVRFPGYSFRVQGTFAEGESTYLQGVFMAQCNDCPEEHPMPQHTRKWLLSRHMTPSELVQTALKLVLTSIEHEAREQFTYKGARVFGPHFDVEALVAIARAERLDTRKEAA